MLNQPAGAAEFARLGVATVYEASGRHGLIDIPLTQIVPGSKVAGPARTVRCGQDDNLMVHAVLDTTQPGDILVLTMPLSGPVALIGEVLATQAAVRQAAGILVDGAVRDVAELQALGLPIWARYIRVRGATKELIGTINQPVTVGGAEIRAGDVVVLDADGGVVVAQENAAGILVAARARAEREAALLPQLMAGTLTYDVHGLRAIVER